MFDYSTQQIDLKIPSPEGTKKATVTFPTDDQWIERMRSQRTIIRNLGRGKSTTDFTDISAHAKVLFDAIKVEGDDFDQWEAQRAIGQLAKAEPEEAERDGNTFVIPIRTIAGLTKHTLRIPSQKDLADYHRRSVSIIDGRHGVQEVRINLQASGELYDKIAVKTEGYAGHIPIIHKSAALNELINLLRYEDEEERDPEV